MLSILPDRAGENSELPQNVLAEKISDVRTRSGGRSLRGPLCEPLRPLRFKFLSLGPSLFPSSNQPLLTLFSVLNSASLCLRGEQQL